MNTNFVTAFHPDSSDGVDDDAQGLQESAFFERDRVWDRVNERGWVTDEALEGSGVRWCSSVCPKSRMSATRSLQYVPKHFSSHR